MNRKEHTALSLISLYDRGGSIPDNDKYIAGVCGCSIRRWRNIRAILEKFNKIFIQEGNIYNVRVEKEIIKASEERQENGRKGGIKSSQMRILSKKTNNLFQGTLKPAHVFQKPESINNYSAPVDFEKINPNPLNLVIALCCATDVLIHHYGIVTSRRKNDTIISN
ncbi:DUF1376 domain-containing protein [Candidatus Liberibacter asiaticus]|uniref:DUF1376 domain-containing protein n=2 Tax=Liberibacter asiaticus TaxID=34021 RepID=UPI00030ACADA|nr:DUF1376 domain-containing protein [Candidatus Liberibacter asiaticus]ALK07663.2 DUF1376 domain-containing protein [Candidatus Liberibacter asiaticus]ASK53157.1 hypothetical protein B2I23_05220 [Candidatus Liberibacter asiaticus]AWL14478.1 DUF1376 domain-containing protein [Candidatus Liberibacter asiaticus]KAE9509681.1 hypothetical protein FXW22_05100 [Candidatus Liberibacter asiaticus]KAE9511527.1 hypothetical protein FXW31_00995 [Candidatus Liberibacter asiaticus]